MERRASKRVSTSVDVDARVGGHQRRATVSNLSTTGCCLEVSNGFVDPGDAIMLVFPGSIRMVGQVVWRDFRSAGIEFRTLMHPSIVAHLGFVDLPQEERALTWSPGGPDWSIDAVQERFSSLTGLEEVVAFFGAESDR